MVKENNMENEKNTVNGTRWNVTEVFTCKERRDIIVFVKILDLGTG